LASSVQRRCLALVRAYGFAPLTSHYNVQKIKWDTEFGIQWILLKNHWQAKHIKETICDFIR